MSVALRLSSTSGVSAYRQIARQVRQAIQMGALQPGDQLPTVKEVVAMVAVNPNTVLKAYQVLEHDGLVEGRQGQGTFVCATLPGPSLLQRDRLQRQLDKWVRSAREVGLDDEGIVTLVEHALADLAEEEIA
jgi:GntR family transcriptional regulator